MIASHCADCDALLGAVADRLGHAVAASPDLARDSVETLAGIRATVLHCADDLQLARSMLAQFVRGAT
jgi:hypothetical protein